MRIGVDLDDVTIDFINPLLRFHNETAKKVISYQDVFTYTLEKVWGGTRQEAIDKIRAFYISDNFDQLKPIDGAVESLLDLSQKHDITFITAIHNESREKTQRWLERTLPFLKAPVFYIGEYNNNDERKVSKAEVCLREGIELIIEDNGKYATDCIQKGVRAYLFNRPWNTKFLDPRLVRVNAWREVLEHLAQ